MSRSRTRRIKAKGSVPTDKSSRGMVAATMGFIGIIFLLIVSSYITMPTGSVDQKSLYSRVEDIPDSIIRSLDAVLILGGGVPSALARPPRYVQQRCDDGAAVVRQHQNITDPAAGGRSRRRRVKPGTLPILCLSAGTKHLPQLLSTDGLPIFESTSCAAYLEEKYSFTKNVYVETTSFDTIGNAFFARTSHTDINGWRNLLIITNQFHMPRTQAIFEWIFGLDRGGYNLIFLESPDKGLGKDAIAARQVKEAKSLELVSRLRKKFISLEQVWIFINEQHAMYTASKLVGRARESRLPETAKLVKETYGGVDRQ